MAIAVEGPQSTMNLLGYSMHVTVLYSSKFPWSGFCDFHYDHKNFCHEIFLTAAYSTGLDTTSKSRKTNESRKPVNREKPVNHKKPVNHENQART